MSILDQIAAAAPWRPRQYLTRLGSRALACPTVLGTLAILICGWKFTFGIGHSLDIDPHHEAMYLAYMLGQYPGGIPPEYSPLYVYLYAFERLFAANIIDLFYVQMAVLTVALPLALFAYLMARRAPLMLALPSSLWLMICVANLPVRPKPMHLALIVLFCGLAVFVKLGARQEKWAWMAFICAALSTIRPELLWSLVIVGSWSVYLVFAGRKLDRCMLLAVGASGAAVAGLYAVAGVPLFGERSVDALAFHFAANYAGWHGETPFTTDQNEVFRQVFGNAQSIPAAFLANPGPFLHSMWSNLLHVPVAFGVFLLHFNLLLPRYLSFGFIEAGIAAVLLVVAVTYYGRQVAASAPGPALSGATRMARAIGHLRRFGAEYPDVVCLLLFLVPYATMMVVLYPRYHYVLAVGTLAFALAIALAAPRLRPARLGRSAFVLALALLAMTPSLGSVGARVDHRIGEIAVAPLTALAEARFLQSLDRGRRITVFESTDPGVSPYAGDNFRSTSPGPKPPSDVGAFLRDNDIGVVIEDERLRKIGRYSRDTEWTRFRAAPGEYGFAAHTLPGTDAILYVRTDLLPRS